MSDELLNFLESTLSSLDDAAGNVDEEAHKKLAELKSVLQGDNKIVLLSEASIKEEIDTLTDRLSSVEERVREADPLTKDLLGLSTAMLAKSEKDKPS